jgi:hypothetical protein
MTINFKGHSEPQPANPDDSGQTAMHAGIVTGDTEEVLKSLDDTIYATVAPYEGRVMDSFSIESLKRKLSAVTHVASVGISLVENEAEVAVRALVNGLESWVSILFHAVSAPSLIQPVDVHVEAEIIPPEAVDVPPENENHE